MIRRISLRLAALLSLPLLACAHPAVKPGTEGSMVMGEANGIRLSAVAEQPSGPTPRSPSQLTPVQVKIENRSGKTLAVAPFDFALTDQAGASYLPVVAVGTKARQARRGTLMSDAAYQHLDVYAPLTEPCGGQDRLADVPYSAFSYTGPLPSAGVFPYAAAGGTSVCPEELPTGQMARAALPEKPLPNGANADGFLYFQGQGDRKAPAKLTMKLVDAVNGQPFGELELRLAANE